jgi:hypothetical protein
MAEFVKTFPEDFKEKALFKNYPGQPETFVMKAVHRGDTKVTVIYHEQGKPDTETGVWEGSLNQDQELRGFLFVDCSPQQLTAIHEISPTSDL